MVGDAFETIEKSRKSLATQANRLGYSAVPGSMAGHGLTLARYATESGKPNNERLAEYTDSRMDGTKKRILSKAPIYPAMEEAQLAAVFRDAKEILGDSDPYVKAVLNGRTPAEAAHDLISRSKLNDPAYRTQLFEGKAAIDASQDPLLELARKVDPILRELTKWRETQIDAIERDPANRISKVRFSIYGRTVPPMPTLRFGSRRES